MNLMKINQKKCTYAQNLAWQTFIQHHVTHLPVDLEKILREKRILIITVNEMPKKFNKTIILDNFLIIAQAQQNRQPTQQQTRYLLAHELGVILLEKYWIQRINEKDKSSEIDNFALQLLAPVCVLKALGITSARAIAQLCNIPLSFAAQQAKRIKLCITPAPFEIALLKQFDEFIKHNRK